MINLQDIGMGVVEERFNDELKLVIQNICDNNTDAKSAREINIKLKLKPDIEDRQQCDLELQVSSKLAPVKTYVSKMAVGVDSKGEVDAEELAPRQKNLFPEAEKKDSSGKVVNMR